MLKKKGESWESWKMRIGFNVFPAYRGSGAKVTYIAGDYTELTIQLPLSLRTRNYVGTIYGGSMYSAVDPMYMLMLMRILGKDHVVWDKAATIRFKRPGTELLTCTFTVSPEQIEEIKTRLKTEPEFDYYFTCYLKNKSGKVVAEIDKTIYVATKEYYKQKRKKA